MSHLIVYNSIPGIYNAKAWTLSPRKFDPHPNVKRMLSIHKVVLLSMGQQDALRILSEAVKTWMLLVRGKLWIGYTTVWKLWHWTDI